MRSAETQLKSRDRGQLLWMLCSDNSFSQTTRPSRLYHMTSYFGESVGLLKTAMNVNNGQRYLKINQSISQYIFYFHPSIYFLFLLLPNFVSQGSAGAYPGIQGARGRVHPG